MWETENNQMWSINLNELNNWILNNVNNFDVNKDINVNVNLNTTSDSETVDEWVMLDKLNIQEEAPKVEQDIDFTINEDEISKKKKHYHIRYRRIFTLSMSVIIISALVSAFCYFYNDYITNNLAEADSNNTYKFVETAKDFINTYTKDIIKPSFDIDLLWTNGKAELDDLISSNLNYIQKRSLLKTNVSNLSNNIISNYANLNTIKKNISRYGFFPKDLENIISESESISSIQNSLTALEAIKFSSAISVFSYLDTFIDSLSQSLWLDKQQVKSSIQQIASRWESDINLYIKNCYLNPFEIGYDCNYIWDFDKYYDIVGDNFNTKFFKELMKYTDSKLEQTEVPSFVISFKEFDQESNEMTFDIEINTFKEDEVELAKWWILSPHIFILNSLINNLKQSRFIIWNDISIKSIDVNPKTINIWFSVFNVNNSTNTFTVHIKKENEIEIDDRVYADY